ncbi:MAG: hypothetical protein AAF320_03225, partial [Myxococcota bacterium]
MDVFFDNVSASAKESPELSKALFGGGSLDESAEIRGSSLPSFSKERMAKHIGGIIDLGACQQKKEFLGEVCPLNPERFPMESPFWSHAASVLLGYENPVVFLSELHGISAEKGVSLEFYNDEEDVGIESEKPVVIMAAYDARFLTEWPFIYDLESSGILLSSLYSFRFAKDCEDGAEERVRIGSTEMPCWAEEEFQERILHTKARIRVVYESKQSSDENGQSETRLEIQELEGDKPLEKELQSRIAHHKNKLVVQNRAITVENSENEERIRVLRAKQKELEKEIEIFEREKTKFKTSSQTLERENQSLKDALKAEKDKNDKLSTRLQQTSNDLTVAQNNVVNLQAQLQQQQQQHQQQMAQLQQQIQQQIAQHQQQLQQQAQIHALALAVAQQQHQQALAAAQAAVPQNVQNQLQQAQQQVAQLQQQLQQQIAQHQQQAQQHQQALAAAQAAVP